MILRDLVCLEHPAVVLPGSTHTLNVPPETGSHLLALWREAHSPPAEDAAAFEHRFPRAQPAEHQDALSTEHESVADMVPVPPTSQYLVALVPRAPPTEPAADPAAACVCRVEAVGKRAADPETRLLVRGIVRATVAVPHLQGETPFVSHVRLEDAAALRAGYPPADVRPALFAVFNQMEAVEAAANEFGAAYSQASQSASSPPALLLSPLANTLYFQLHSPQARRNWAAVKRTGTAVVRRIVHSGEETEPADISPVLLLMDRVVAMVPGPAAPRREFLAAAQLARRLALFAEVAEAFVAACNAMRAAAAYLAEHYAGASVLERTALVAMQLRGLRGFVGETGETAATPRISAASPLPPTLSDSDDRSKLSSFMERVANGQLGLHPDAIHSLTKDYEKLRGMRGNKSSAEYLQLQAYFDVVADIPFGKYAARGNAIDLPAARAQLDADHFGLGQVKRRLLEYLSVLKLAQMTPQDSAKSAARPPIMMLVGPPGVGKTSIARSVARVLGRKYQRVSLGGIYNEADLRGHRRTYVGAMCGAIVSALRKSGSMDPLILLDELDKVGTMGSRTASSSGNPEGALLEILDFEQNAAFADHYVGFPIDISQALFFCTANDAAAISPPLLDRLEIIRIPGYTAQEKVQIGAKFLLPKQIALNGLDRCGPAGKFTLRADAWRALVSGYTSEAGVRTLERKLAAIVRARIVRYVGGKQDTLSAVVTPEEVSRCLGFPRIRVTQEVLAPTRFEESRGIVNGLSYSSNGTGSVMLFEVVRTGSVSPKECDGPLVRTTGNLGDTLRESVQIATSVVQSIIARGIVRGMDTTRFLHSRFHLHAPTGGVPKDGPSAGLAITLCLLSHALDLPVPRDLCTTGEITLRGKVLPIGGLKEKLLGASASRMRRVLLPWGNCNDVVAAAVEDVAPYVGATQTMAARQTRDAALLRSRTGLQLQYVSDIYDAIAAVWPEVQFHAGARESRESPLQRESKL